MAFDPISIGVSLLGGLLGSKNKGTTATEKREPWAPAQQYLIDNLATNKKLQDYYAQNPFNGLQQQGYENLYGDQNNFRQNIAPGMMDFANGMMGSKYERKALTRPGTSRGYTGLLGDPAQQPAQQPAQSQQSGLLGPFSVAPSTPYSVGNLNQQNPMYQTPEMIEAAKVAAEQERLRLLAQQQQYMAQPDYWQTYMTGLGGGTGNAGNADASGSVGDT